MEIEKLITKDRSRTSQTNNLTLLAVTQSDRARLLYSAPFRRLQQKAQVFSLESNSAVRSRLTHSIEVSHIGRYIVAQICEKMLENTEICKNDKDFWSTNSLQLSNIVETACLMHDIGNPPFGHFGEAAIVDWAKNEGNIKKLINQSLEKDSKDYEKLMNDFRFFDGNPQGLRIITKLQGDDGFNGFNLTYTQILSYLKYTYSPNEIKEKANDQKPFSSKVGFFETESKLISNAWDCLGMPHNSRHPLSFIMEASDDISYCVSDIEDGIEKGVIYLQHFRTYVLNSLEKIKNNHNHSIDLCERLKNSLDYEKERNINIFLNFKTVLSNELVSIVADKFIDNYKIYFEFQAKTPIIKKETVEYDLLNILKKYTSKYLFTSYEAESIELSGYAIISGILKKYEKLLQLKKNDFLFLLSKDNGGIKSSSLDYHRRLFNRLPLRHIKSYKSAIMGKELFHIESAFLDETSLSNKIEEQDNAFRAEFEKLDPSKEWNLRVHLIIDFISGMTDQFAMEFYQKLKGIDVKE